MDLKKIIETSVRESLKKSGKLPVTKTTTKTTKKQPVTKKEQKVVQKPVLNEALVATPQSFHLVTDRISEETKRTHQQLYQNYVDAFNKSSSGLDAANVHDANSNRSEYRSLKNDETWNLNAIKLHELYFHNISDLASEISVDSLPYMRLSRDFGTFEQWQFDFMAACRSARNGWALVVYEPYKNVYMNVVVDLHNVNIPLGTIPVLVIDMWEHAYFIDYQNNKEDYIVAMMQELNWNVVEARMTLAERSELNALYYIKPVYNLEPQKMLNTATNPPIDRVAAPGQVEVSPTTPAGPEVIAPNGRKEP